MLSENYNVGKLSALYRGLMESESGHCTTFVPYSKKYGVGIDLKKRWSEWLEFEALVIANYDKNKTIYR